MAVISTDDTVKLNSRYFTKTRTGLLVMVLLAVMLGRGEEEEEEKGGAWFIVV